MAHILLVDDEQSVLNALRRELSGEHEVEMFTSPREALARATTTSFDLVVSDYRMPEMDGVTFLMTFAQSQPDAVRLMLSGQADMDALIDAINVSHAYGFLEKPWDAAELSTTINQALNYRAALLENGRLAEAYRRNHVEFPAAQERCQYHALLVMAASGNAGAVMRELSTDPARQHGLPYPPPQASTNMTFKVDLAATRSDALQRLEQSGYDLVIADAQLPDVDCVPFLDEMRRISPQSAYILVGNQLDMPTLGKLINQAHIDDFLKWPWHGQELRLLALRSLRYRDLRQQNLRLADLFRQKTRPDITSA